MKENRTSVLLLILVLVILAGVAYYIVQTVRDSAQQAVAPWQQANNSLQTQVSDLLHPTPTIIPDPVTYINQIQALARLETIEFSVEKVVTAEEQQGTFGFLFGDKLLFVAHGTVIAGIDMSKITPSDLQLQGNVLTVKLPPAEIFVATLDNQKSYVYDRTTGIMSKPDPNLETLARQKAEDMIRQAALDDKILDLAQQNAQAYLSKFFAALGYPNAIFVTQ